jgi:hypothetical protein
LTADATISLLDSPDVGRRRPVVLPALATGLFFAVVATLLLGLAVQPDLHRDENQFIASGAVLARQGLLPYRDYPYFHVPNLVFVYALIDRLTNHLLLGARLLSVSCAMAVAVMVFVFTFGTFNDRGGWVRWLLSAAAVVVMMGSRVYSYACGKAWNHDLPLMLSVAAFLCVVKGVRSRPAWKWLAASGFLMGLAAGTRLTYAPAACAMAAIALVAPNLTWRQRWGAWGIFTAAGLVSLTPSAICFALAPRQFVFGNVEFPALSTAIHTLEDTARQTAGHVLAMKLAAVMKQTVARGSNVFLFAAGAAVYVAARRRGIKMGVEVVYLLAIILFFWTAACLPTPTYMQYFYEALPFMVMHLALMTRTAFAGRALPWKSIGLLVFAMTIGFGPKVFAWQPEPAWQPYRAAMTSEFNGRWMPLEIHNLGVEMAGDMNSSGPVLTLQPTIALEGGLRIYPDFVTGVFAFRAAPTLPARRRVELDMVAPNDLPGLFAQSPPRAFLTSPDDSDVEAPFLDEAMRRHWTSRSIAGHLLWQDWR